MKMKNERYQKRQQRSYFSQTLKGRSKNRFILQKNPLLSHTTKNDLTFTSSTASKAQAAMMGEPRRRCHSATKWAHSRVLCPTGSIPFISPAGTLGGTSGGGPFRLVLWVLLSATHSEKALSRWPGNSGVTSNTCACWNTDKREKNCILLKHCSKKLQAFLMGIHSNLKFRIS